MQGNIKVFIKLSNTDITMFVMMPTCFKFYFSFSAVLQFAVFSVINCSHVCNCTYTGFVSGGKLVMQVLLVLSEYVLKQFRANVHRLLKQRNTFNEELKRESEFSMTQRHKLAVLALYHKTNQAYSLICLFCVKKPAHQWLTFFLAQTLRFAEKFCIAKLT